MNNVFEIIDKCRPMLRPMRARSQKEISEKRWCCEFLDSPRVEFMSKTRHKEEQLGARSTHDNEKAAFESEQINVLS